MKQKRYNEEVILTIGLTCCYKSDIIKLEQMIHSLFSSKHNLLDSLNYKYDYIKELKYKVELFVVIDDNPVLKNTSTNSIITLLNHLNKLLYKHVIVKYVVTPSNIKVSCARNIIINEASGEYLVFADDDDLRCNINKLIEIIEKNYGNDYISHYVQNTSRTNYSNLTFKPRISNISVWNSIIKTEFIRKHKLYLTPFLATEDVIWRSNLSYILENSNAKTIQIPDVCYIYMEQSNRSLNHFGIDSRFLDNIDFNNRFILEKSNDEYYNGVNKILSQQLEIGFKLTDWRLFAIASSMTFYKQYNIIREWLNNNISLIKDGYDLKMLKLTNKLNDVPYENLFSILTNEDKILCLQSYVKFSTLPDLYEFAKYIDSNITLDIVNALWNNSLFYKIYESRITSYEHFNNFVYRFLYLLWLRKGNKNYGKYIDKELCKEIYDMYLEEISMMNINEVLHYIHDKLCIKNINSNIYSHFKNYVINMDDVDKEIEYIKDGDNEYNELIDKYCEEFKLENNIKTTKLGKTDINYKGPLNIFLFYLLSTPIINKLMKIPKVLNSVNYNGCEYKVNYFEDYYHKSRCIKFDLITSRRNYDKLLSIYNNNEVIRIINVNEYSYKKVKKLINNRINPKLLVKFRYKEIKRLISSEINLNLFEYESNYFTDRINAKLIMKLNDNEIHLLNDIKIENGTHLSRVLTRILTLSRLLNYSCEEIISEVNKKVVTVVKYDKFATFNSNFETYFRIPKTDVGLYSNDHINTKFINYMITACNSKNSTRVKKFINKNNNYFEKILSIIDLYVLYEKEEEIKIERDIKCLDKLLYDLCECKS